MKAHRETTPPVLGRGSARRSGRSLAFLLILGQLALLSLTTASAQPAGVSTTGFMAAFTRATEAQPPAPDTAPLVAALEARVRAGRAIAPELGVHVVDLESGRSVYGEAEETPRILASNTKLFTTAAALDRLGPGYFFETLVLLDGPVKEGVLSGRLAILGSGDPNISGRHHFGDSLFVFRNWAHKLRQQGLRRIEGDLYLVSGLFDGPWIHPDWPKDQLTRWYEAPVDSLSFNDNCVLVRIWPSQPGHLARVEVLPPLYIFDVRNSVRTTTSPKRHNVAVDRPLGTNELEVRGAILAGSEPVEAWVTVEDPVQYFGAALTSVLADEGIEFDGKLFRASGLPGGDWRVATSYRSDLLTTLEVINKRSQNFYAESLLKVLGARQCAQGDWPGGVQAVAEFLDEVGLDRGRYQLADGSGMSRGNRASPRQMTDLLRHMYSHRWRAEFLRTLPYSGEPELSWEKRLSEPPYAGNVFAKTGTLNSVSTLSGYARGLSGRLYAFSILCNRSRNGWESKRFQDRVVRALIDHG